MKLSMYHLIYYKGEKKMDRLDVLDRLKEELNIPFLEIKLAEKDYTEDDYQQLKNELVQYFDDYVRNVEN